MQSFQTKRAQEVNRQRIRYWIYDAAVLAGLLAIWLAFWFC